jgi:molybdenum cofactor synthesis domain-containing protein
MPTLEIITIGTELLLGEIQDTNSTYIARTLRDHGIDIYRITTIGDNADRIASAIKEALGRAEIVITTGGLGPTIDDPTRQAVALAADRELVFLPTLWDQILERFKAYGHEPTENNRRRPTSPRTRSRSITQSARRPASSLRSAIPVSFHCPASPVK